MKIIICGRRPESLSDVDLKAIKNLVNFKRRFAAAKNKEKGGHKSQK